MQEINSTFIITKCDYDIWGFVSTKYVLVSTKIKKIRFHEKFLIIYSSTLRHFLVPQFQFPVSIDVTSLP
jgi:hypothetical protein